MLQLPSPNHSVDNLEHRPFRILLLGEVLHDVLLGDLGADGEAPLQLLLDATEHLVLLLGGEALAAWNGQL